MLTSNARTASGPNPMSAGRAAGHAALLGAMLIALTACLPEMANQIPPERHPTLE